MSSNSPVPETRDRLAKLVGEKKVDSIVEAKRSKLVDERNVVLGKGASDGFAEFHIVQRGPAVENVKFSKGSAGLKDFGDKLRSLKYPGLASAADTRLYRKGIVSCSKAKCDLVLVPTVFAFDGATDVPADLQGLFDHVSEQKDAPSPK